MIGVRSRMSLRLENFAGIICPVAPIGPDDGDCPAAVGVVDELALTDAAGSAPAFSDVPEPLVCGSLAGAAPSDGCVAGAAPSEGSVGPGFIKAARDSSGVGIFRIAVDVEGTCCSTPGL